MNNALSVRMYVRLNRRISAASSASVCEFNEGCPTSNGIDITEPICL